MEGKRPVAFGRGRIRNRSPVGGSATAGSTCRRPSPERGFTSSYASTATDTDSVVTFTPSTTAMEESMGSMAITTVQPQKFGPGSGTPRGAKRGARDDSDYHETLVTKPDGKIKEGKAGTTLNLRANYFPVKAAPSWSLYQYRVDFQPDEDSVKKRKRMLKLAISSLNFGYMFDGTVMYSSKLLQREGQDLQPEEGLTFTLAADVWESTTGPVTITVKLVGFMKTGSPVYIQLYNLLVRKCLFALDLEEMGRNFFDPKAAIRIPNQRLELWPGYVTSLRIHEKQLLLCVEVTHKVLRLDNVLTLIKGIQKSGNFGNNTNALMSAVNSELKDTIVMTTYNKKTYHVDDVDFGITPKSTFPYKGGEISFAEYYKAKYDVEIKDMDQPLLISRPSKRDVHRGDMGNALLIPEFCQSTGLTDAMRANFSLMKELSKHLHQGPGERVRAIENFMKRLTGHTELMAEMSSWGLEFQTGLVPVPGRIMPRESIQFAGTGVQAVDTKGDFTMAFRQQKMLSCVDLTNWVIIVPQRDGAGVDNLVRTMSKVATPLSMRIGNPKQVFNLPDSRTQTYLRSIDEAVQKIPNLQMLFVILPNNKLELYAAVKKRLAVDIGIPSQCFLAKNVGSKGLMSIATKVVVQMNAKLGGEPWTIKLPMKNTMFIGFDVYHGAKGSKGGSIGAMVATISPNFTKYYSTTSLFKSSEELSKTISKDVEKCIMTYQKVNGTIPDKIFMYRDGVGDSQLRDVYLVELENLKASLKQLYDQQNKEIPKFTYIVVTKRINTRVFLSDKGYDNPMPGTVVDSVVTMPERYDFFLISCAARQGTISPCNYNVLHDESGMDADKIQLITYKMCHMYYNWSGTIAVPAPCQYAHKLAFLSGMAYAGHANPKLGQLLHFL